MVRRGITLVVAFALAGASCSGSGYQYVSDRSSGTYFKVPDDWELFEVTADDRPDSAFPQRPWHVAFDASPDPTLDHLGTITDHPVGYARVVTFTGDRDRSTMSLSTLRSLALDGQGDPLTLIADGSDNLELVDYGDVVDDDGHHGNRIVLNVKRDDGSFFTIAQIAMLDPGTRQLYQLYVRCSSECFQQYRTEIDRLLDSWTIEPKD